MRRLSIPTKILYFIALLTLPCLFGGCKPASSDYSAQRTEDAHWYNHQESIRHTGGGGMPNFVEVP